MLSYLHRYHAGNFADLHKHLALLAVLKKLQEKPAPFSVLDAFAGEGFYDLGSVEAQKNQEHLQGAARLSSGDILPELLHELIQVKDRSQEFYKIPNLYPGSPALIHKYLRKGDRAVFFERHPTALYHLKKYFHSSEQIAIHNRDAFEGIYALTPFKERRGLVFIDPSYEVKDEYQKLALLIKKTYEKFSNGIYVIWYPLLKAGHHFELLTGIQQGQINSVLQMEWILDDKNTEKGMYGSGLLMINPPWKIEETLKEHFEFLKRSYFPDSLFR